MADIQIQSANSLYKKGQYHQAAQAFALAADELLQQGDRAGAAEQFNNQSVAWLMAGSFSSSLDAAETAERIFIEFGDVNKQAIAAGNKGSAYEAMGKNREALYAFQTSVDLFTQAGEKENRLLIYKRMAALSLKMGQPLDALGNMNTVLVGSRQLTLVEKVLKKLLEVMNRLLRG